MPDKSEGDRFEVKAEILKGLAHPVRIAIAEMLADREICACDIAGMFSLDRTSVSKHLARMARLHIISARRDGQNLYYRLEMKCLLSALHCLDGVIERAGSGES